LFNNKPGVSRKEEYAPEGQALVNIFDNEEGLGGIEPSSSAIKLDPAFHMTPEPGAQSLTPILVLYASTSSLKTPSPPFPPTPPTALFPTTSYQFSRTPPLPSAMPPLLSQSFIPSRQDTDTPHPHTGNFLERSSDNKRLHRIVMT
jgi:hypothetical protein